MGLRLDMDHSGPAPENIEMVKKLKQELLG
jgi:hypothetical protein